MQTCEECNFEFCELECPTCPNCIVKRPRISKEQAISLYKTTVEECQKKREALEATLKEANDKLRSAVKVVYNVVKLTDDSMGVYTHETKGVIAEIPKGFERTDVEFKPISTKYFDPEILLRLCETGDYYRYDTGRFVSMSQDSSNCSLW